MTWQPPSAGLLHLPKPFDEELLGQFEQKWRDNSDAPSFDEPIELAGGTSATLGDMLKCLFGNSRYLANLAVNNVPHIGKVVGDGPDPPWRDICEGVKSLSGVSQPDLLTGLRKQKAAAALHIALCEICGWWPLTRITQEWSTFADLCVRAALTNLLLAEHDKENIALPDPEHPEQGCGVFVLALGKLGAFELNYSSDIDLMVLFDPEALPYRGSKSPQEFAVKLAKNLVAILDQRTPQGYVFRTDLRLRPDPSSTAIAVSVLAAEQYYESWGQNWERSALIKARPIAGDQICAEQFLSNLEPFIWRKSLDFYAIQDIHSIKRQMYAAKGGSEVDVLGHDLKTGRGGIREIEFFAQIQQLIWGGRIPEVRTPSTLAALGALLDQQIITDNVRAELSDSYVFLRHLENRLQMIGDEQTQQVPADIDEARRLACFFGYDDFDTFASDVETHLRTVESHYADLFEDSPSLAIEGNLVFTGADHDPETLSNLSRLGFENAETVSRLIREWHYGKYRATKSTKSRQILTELMPGVVSAFSKTMQPDRAFIKFDQFLQGLPAGVQIFSIFQRHPQVLELVAEIMGNAPRLADYLTSAPQRLDYVVDPEFFSPLQDTDVLREELGDVLQRTEEFELKLDASRRWTNDMRFRVGIQALRGNITLHDAAVTLSDIAETNIQLLTAEVAEEFTRQFGSVKDGTFAVMGYGKLGAKELTPISDLDLVFVYNADPDGVSEGGARSLPVTAYYLRFAQRLNSALTVMTAEGRLYDVDLRLRPAGDQGPFAASFEAYSKYLKEDAWVWEKLALVRARVVYASGDLGTRLSKLRIQTLRAMPDRRELAEAITEMRERIQTNLQQKHEWDTKRIPGGQMDTEFLLDFHAVEAARAQGHDISPLTADMLTLIKESESLSEADQAEIESAYELWAQLSWLLRLTVASDGDALNQVPLGLESRLLSCTAAASLDDLKTRIRDHTSHISHLIDRDITSLVKT